MRWRWCAGGGADVRGADGAGGAAGGGAAGGGGGAGVGGGAVPGAGAGHGGGGAGGVAGGGRRTCRWIRGTRRGGWGSCWPTAGRGCWSGTGRWRAGAGRRGGAGRGAAVVWLDDPAVRAALAAGGAAPVPAAAVAGAAGVRDLHVGVDGGAEGGAGHARGAGELLAGWQAAYSGLGPGVPVLSVRACEFRWTVGRGAGAVLGGVLVVGPVGVQVRRREWAGLLAAQGVRALECAPRYRRSLLAVLAAGRGGAGGAAAGGGDDGVWRWRGGGAVRGRRWPGGAWC